MISNYRKRTRQQAVLGVVIPVLLLAVSLTTFAERKQESGCTDRTKKVGCTEEQAKEEQIVVECADENVLRPVAPATSETDNEILTRLKALEEMILELKQELQKRDSMLQSQLEPLRLMPETEMVWV